LPLAAGAVSSRSNPRARVTFGAANVRSGAAAFVAQVAAARRNTGLTSAVPLRRLGSPSLAGPLGGRQVMHSVLFQVLLDQKADHLR